MPEFTAAQLVIQKRVLCLDAQIERYEKRCEQNVERARTTAADRAEKLLRARWDAKIKPLREECDVLRAELPSEE
jgi:excinuclease UvrABC nuclease subunit